MALKERKNSVAVIYRDERGKQQTASGFATKREAKAWERKKLEEIAARRRGDVWEPELEIPTLDELVEHYLATHVAAANTLRTIRERTVRLRRQFGDQRVDRIPHSELRAWSTTLPAGSRYGTIKIVRQVFRYASKVYRFENPAADLQLGQEPRRDVEVFEPDEIAAICRHLDNQDGAMVRLGFATGLRPEELFALERADVDRNAGVLQVRRTICRGEVREAGKTPKSLRPVPLTSAALEAYDSLALSLVDRKLFPSPTGKWMDLHNFSERFWRPALEAAGVPYRPFGTLRHSFASRAIAAGVPAAELAVVMGTSVKQIERTYHRQLRDSHTRFVGRMEAFEASQQEASNG
jgi:integrase